MLGWFLGGVGLLLSGWGIVSTYRMLYPKPRPVVALQSPPWVSTTSLVSHDGEPFELWVLESRQPRGVVITCHGYQANRFQLVEIVQGLCQRGYTALVFDLRGHGTRRGPCTFGINDVGDIGVILRWLRQQQGLGPLPVGLFGLSLGGAIACQAARRYPECGAVVVDSTYARLFPILARALKRDYRLPTIPWAWVTWVGVHAALCHRLSQVDPFVLAAKTQQPLLIIHGTDDQSVPVDHAKALYARWHGPKEQWIEPDVGHVGMYAHDPKGYCDRVAHFFDRWLKPQSPSSPC